MVYIPQQGDVVEIPVYFGAASDEPIILLVAVPDFEVWDAWERTRTTVKAQDGQNGAGMLLTVDHDADAALIKDNLVGVKNLEAKEDGQLVQVDEAYRERNPDTWKDLIPPVLLRRAAAYFYQPTLRAPVRSESPEAQEKK